MRVGSLNNSINGELANNAPSKHVSREEIAEFLDICMVAKQSGEKEPKVETTERIIEHYNRNMKGFKDVGYFMLDGVKVYLTGQVLKEEQSMEKKLFHA